MPPMSLQVYGKASKDVKLSVMYKPLKTAESPVMDGIRGIYSKGLLADVTLVAGEKMERFAAHKLVLASKSEMFYEMCSQEKPGEPSAPCEIRLYEICPAAVKTFLDHVYLDKFEPAAFEITIDVLKLAQQFKLPELVEKCAEALSKDITTTNVVERLGLCDEFELPRLREKIMEQLTSNKKALHGVAQSKEIVNYPRLMQEMLGVIAHDGLDENPKKRAKKA